MISAVDKEPWSTTLKRRTQHYGYEYNYKSKNAAQKTRDFPEWSADLTSKLIKDIYPRAPEQLIVNEYEPGQGISKHTDAGIFDEPIASLSLGSSCVMIFRKKEEIKEVLLPRRSLVVMSGESRWSWTHEIPQRKSDTLKGNKLKRTRRISLTFRLRKEKQ